MTTPTPDPAPVPPVHVRLLATIDPTPTDRQRYGAGELWVFPAARAEALVAQGLATRDVLSPWPPPAAAPAAAPAATAPAFPEEE